MQVGCGANVFTGFKAVQLCDLKHSLKYKHFHSTGLRDFKLGRNAYSCFKSDNVGNLWMSHRSSNGCRVYDGHTVKTSKRLSLSCSKNEPVAKLESGSFWSREEAENWNLRLLCLAVGMACGYSLNLPGSEYDKFRSQVGGLIAISRIPYIIYRIIRDPSNFADIIMKGLKPNYKPSDSMDDD